MPELLLQAMSAKHSGDIALAKQLLSQALIQDPTNEAAWMLMSEVVEDVKLRRNCLERVLRINPDNTAASTALAKLNTAPLSPITRGERDKPFLPPKTEKTPPFTPPFTWDDSQEQYLALGDMTFQDVPVEPEPQPPEEVTPTFDWANDSDEPDKTIQRIFTAVSNPELASLPLPETELSTPEELPANVQAAQPLNAPEIEEDRWVSELVGPEIEEEALIKPQPAVVEEFTVSAEPQFGMNAFSSPKEPIEPLTSDYLLWDNPSAKADRLVIMSNKSLIYANPQPTDIPHILGLFEEKKMIRDLLGSDARMIRLDTIKRLTTCPNSSDLTIDFVNKNKMSSHQLTFYSPQTRDEVMRAFQIRIGANSRETAHIFKIADKIVPPLVVLLFLAFLFWGVIAGVPLLSEVPTSQLGQLQPLVNILESIITSIGTTNLLLMIGFCIVLNLVWLISNLRKPSNLIVVDYP